MRLSVLLFLALTACRSGPADPGVVQLQIVHQLYADLARDTGDTYPDPERLSMTRLALIDGAQDSVKVAGLAPDHEFSPTLDGEPWALWYYIAWMSWSNSDEQPDPQGRIDHEDFVRLLREKEGIDLRVEDIGSLVVRLEELTPMVQSRESE